MKECVIYDGKLDNERAHVLIDYLELILNSVKDKDGNILTIGDKVSYNGKGEFVFTFFPEYGMFGLLDGDRPLGRSGSSTRYEPYILNKYHRNKIKKL